MFRIILKLMSADHTADTLPTHRTTLKLKSWLPDTPGATLHRTDVADSHTVCSHIVRPDLAEAVKDA